MIEQNHVYLKNETERILIHLVTTTTQKTDHEKVLETEGFVRCTGDEFLTLGAKWGMGRIWSN